MKHDYENRSTKQESFESSIITKASLRGKQFFSTINKLQLNTKVGPKKTTIKQRVYCRSIKIKNKRGKC